MIETDTGRCAGLKAIAVAATTLGVAAAFASPSWAQVDQSPSNAGPPANMSGGAMPSTTAPPVTVQGQSSAAPKSTAPSATTSSQAVTPEQNIQDTRVTGETPVPARQGFQMPGENPGYLFNLATYGQDVGQSLARHGVYLHAATQLSDLSVVDGGHKGGSEFFNLGYFGTTVDPGQALGILQGGLLDITLSEQTGGTLAGDNITGSESLTPYAFGDQVRLVNFYYSQSFFDHALQITLGRIEAGYTATPYLSPGIHQAQWYCNFFSVSCGNTNAFALNSNKAPYNVGSWGGFITIHPAPHWYLKGGVYENQPLEVTTEDHLGFPGRDWGFNEASGALFPIQLGYVTSAGESQYPTNFHIGGYYDSAKFPDKYYNSRLLPAATHPGAPLFDQGVYGIFTGLQQTVWRFGDDPRSTRGLSLFFSGDWDVTGIQTFQQQYIVGFVMTGPFAHRAADTVNLLVSTQNFDSREEEARDLLAVARHVVGYHAGQETGLEVNYGAAVAPGLSVYPYLQYVKNPDQIGVAVPDPKDDHSLALGVRATVRFDVLFGLPQPH
jgi:porin